LITFYEDGSIESLFPLNGQISAFWSEEEEGALARKFDFTFHERITIDTPIGKIKGLRQRIL
jgi:hypothetical protein